MRDHLIVCMRSGSDKHWIVVENRRNTNLAIGSYSRYAYGGDSHWKPHLVSPDTNTGVIYGIVERANDHPDNRGGPYFFQRRERAPVVPRRTGRFAVVRWGHGERVIVRRKNSADFSVGRLDQYGPGGKYFPEDGAGYGLYMYGEAEHWLPKEMEHWTGMEFIRWEYLDGSTCPDTGSEQAFSTSAGREMYAVTFTTPARTGVQAMIRSGSTMLSSYSLSRLGELQGWRLAGYATENEAATEAGKYITKTFGEDFIADVVPFSSVQCSSKADSNPAFGCVTTTITEGTMGTINTCGSKKNPVPDETTVRSEQKTINVNLSVPDCNGRAVAGQVMYENGEPTQISVSSGGYGCATTFESVDHVRRASRALAEFADLVEQNAFQGSATASE